MLVPLDATWRFLDNGTDQGTTWTSLNFVDNTWSAGQAELGYGDGDEVTIVNYGPNRNNKHITTYFRHSFLVTNVAIIESLSLKLIRDDGAVVYLNGAEVLRNNLPSGPINYSTLATTDISGTGEVTFVTTNLPPHLLRAGNNVVAVEIHQVNKTSDDISFALELAAAFRNNPPSVALIAPTNGATFLAPTNVTLAAEATDPEGALSRVEFFENTNRLAEITSPPFEFTWPAIGPGIYSLYAIAVDAQGARATSSVATITVRSNLPPSVTLLNPTNGAVFISPATIIFNANAVDPDGAVARLEFYQGDMLIGEDASEPYSFAVSNVVAGNYQFRVIAVDDLGARSSSEVVDIIVRDNVPPSVEFITPASNAVFIALGDIPIQLGATDSDGAIISMELFFGTDLLATAATNSLTYAFSNASPGEYTFVARATDDHGASASNMVSITVRSNLPPTVDIATPTNGQAFAVPALVAVLATASDDEGEIRRIELWEGTNKLAESSSSPLSFDWPQETAGAYELFAIATDRRGQSSTSSVVTISLRIPGIIRGPYLQLGTPTAMTVRWRTDLPTNSVVRYGTNASSLDFVLSEPAARIDHEMRITGLTPRTEYFYSVGSTTHTLAEGPEYSFLTSPDSSQPARIWILGDSGRGNDWAAQVRDAYYAFNGTNRTDLWLMLGDNAYYSGLDHEHQIALFDMYPQTLRQLPLWPTIGNHEAYSADTNGHFAYLDIFSLPTAGEAGGVPSGSERYYSFDFGNIHFVCLDSMTVDRTTNGAMHAWLREDLAANTNHWLIAFWHHPPYSKGVHDSDYEIELFEMRENIVPLLESYGVDLVLAGHSHSYERSFLMNGHYGTSDTLVPSMIKDAGDGRPTGTGAYHKDALAPFNEQGAVYVVAGSSAWIDWGEMNHPAMFISLVELGSLVLDVHGHVLDLKFLRENGAIRDSFTLIKGAPTNVLQVTGLKISDGMLTLTWNSVLGESYYVERATRLFAQPWDVVSEAIPAVSRSTSWSQPVERNAGAYFYRVVQFKQ